MTVAAAIDWQAVGVAMFRVGLIGLLILGGALLWHWSGEKADETDERSRLDRLGDRASDFLNHDDRYE